MKPMIANVTKPDEKLSFKRRMIALFDLDLLKDPIYISMVVGMSVAIFAEMNFSLLTPFILSDMGCSRIQIAGVMSTVAIADIVARFISPFVGDHYKQTARNMYIYSLAMLILMRTSLIFAVSYPEMIAVAVGLGAAKGVRTVYMSLVIPSYVPLVKLASASGIQMVLNGMLFLAFGPLLGVLRDITGSYTRCIIVINTVTLFTIVLWNVEKCVTIYSKKKKLKTTI